MVHQTIGALVGEAGLFVSWWLTLARVNFNMETQRLERTQRTLHELLLQIHITLIAGDKFS
jgi:hypothetical protein